VASRGHLDRLGNKINRNARDAVLPSSSVDATFLPSPMSLDSPMKIAADEHVKSGYSIFFPDDGTDDAGKPTFGVFTLSNQWPPKTGEAKAVYIDQFDGSTI
jgi:hypothetical protein